MAKQSSSAAVDANRENEVRIRGLERVDAGPFDDVQDDDVEIVEGDLSVFFDDSGAPAERRRDPLRH